ncbi:MAG: hypothetical protein M1828_001367 [Chrysothrix sp. TS-e1954]|nr:MAG: hypothetical protein M1828_001367 [Chrysothrix sp. TS-e1954]
MALLQSSLIWVTYAVALALLVIIAAIFVYIYQSPRDRAASITTVCILTVSTLLATVLLLPVDIALVSSTTSSKTGLKKDWATEDRVDNIVFGLKVVYFTLYSLDALLCLLVVPFTYFFYEEYDDREAEAGTQSIGQRLWAASKYTLVFLFLCIILFLVGFFLPVKEKHKDLDYFKDLLTKNQGERALTFALGLLITLGTLLYVLYTSAGLALLPTTLIRSAPAISAPNLASTAASELEQNRERQRQLELRNEGRETGLEPRDRRELEALVRDERTLVRRERLAAESSGEGHALIKIWSKVGAVFRPFKLIGGMLLLLVAVVIWVSMLITAIDKAKNSICGTHCGYLLGHINIFQPMNFIFVAASRVFPIDYILFLLLVLFFFSASVIGIATVGIRFLWIVLFKIRKGKTSPQALLMATVMLLLMSLAINYALAMVVAPQYATYGPQTFCDRLPRHPGEEPNCTGHEKRIKPCTELAENPAAAEICTPSVASTFINSITVNFPFFGVVIFWAQFAFLGKSATFVVQILQSADHDAGVFLIVLVTTLVRTPKLDTDELDEDLEDEEEEGLLSSTGRRFNATWQDITGRARKANPVSYGSTGGGSGSRS